jgi:uncharacterized C2H2 Zn-finger protein
LRKTIARIVSEDGYAYWNGETNEGNCSGGESFHGHVSELNDARNLDAGLDYRDVKLAKSHWVYTSIGTLVDEADIDWDTTITCPDCGETFESQDAYDGHDCGGPGVECEDCGQMFDDRSSYQDHLPCGDGPLPVSASASTSSPYSVSRALNEMQADIDRAIEGARAEYPGHPDEIVTVTDGIWIRIADADGWKGAWFTANKLSDSDEFADDTLVSFDYTAHDDSGSEADITFVGDPEKFASHFRFNMEPEDFSSPSGERVAEADFSIELDRQDDPMLYGETFEALEDLLAVDNAFTVTMEAEVEIRARNHEGS